MLSSKASRSAKTRLLAAGAVLTLGALSLTACGGGSSPSSSASSDEKIGVSLIVKTTSNPFFVSMQDGAKKAAEADGVDLKLAAGKADGDEDTQIQAIENAISKGDKGILITPNGPSVVDALKKAKDAKSDEVANKDGPKGGMGGEPKPKEGDKDGKKLSPDEIAELAKQYPEVQAFSDFFARSTRGLIR